MVRRWRRTGVQQVVYCRSLQWDRCAASQRPVDDHIEFITEHESTRGDLVFSWNISRFIFTLIIAWLSKKWALEFINFFPIEIRNFLIDINLYLSVWFRIVSISPTIRDLYKFIQMSLVWTRFNTCRFNRLNMDESAHILCECEATRANFLNRTSLLSRCIGESSSIFIAKQRNFHRQEERSFCVLQRTIIAH